MKSRYSAKDSSDKNGLAIVNKTGVLLTNLGTPDQATAKALRHYLRQFLSDPRVVEIPRLIWMVILHGIILRVRPKKSAKLYQSIWTEQGSPLLVISKAQRDKVAQKITKQYGDSVMVDVAMRYGNPSISSALKKFQQQGINKLVVLPLYPQYAGPTTASTFDALTAELKQWRYIPSINFINSYHDNPAYIKALANTVTEHINQHGVPDKLILSYHGMPELFHQWGDPYYNFCQLTSSLLIAELTATHLDSADVKVDVTADEAYASKACESKAKPSLTAENIVTTFQSRFGKATWLQPYTDETLANLPAAGDKHVAIISPAFSADCLETLEELEHENRDVFMQAGGEHYHYIAALNDRDDHIDAIMAILSPQLVS